MVSKLHSLKYSKNILRIHFICSLSLASRALSLFAISIDAHLVVVTLLLFYLFFLGLHPHCVHILKKGFSASKEEKKEKEYIFFSNELLQLSNLIARPMASTQRKGMDDAREYFTRAELPRGFWLCVSSNKFNEYSVSFHGSESVPELLSMWRSAAIGKLKFCLGVPIFRPSPEESWGGHSAKWYALGTRPNVTVFQQISTLPPLTPPPTPRKKAASVLRSMSPPPTLERGYTDEAAEWLSDLAVPSQSPLVAWSIGQISKLVELASGGKVSILERKPEGLGEYVTLSSGFTLSSMETVRIGARGPPRLHGNLRYMMNTSTVPNFTPESAERSLVELGFRVPQTRKIYSDREAVFEKVKDLSAASMEKKRMQVAAKATEFVTIKGEKVPKIIAQFDGFGPKRSYNSYHTGSTACAVLMDADGGVIGTEIASSTDVRRERYIKKHGTAVGAPQGSKTFSGSAATGETHCVEKFGEKSILSKTPLYIGEVACDGDCSSSKAFNRGVGRAKDALGIEDDLDMQRIAVICHEIKNFNKDLLKFKRAELTDASGISAGRVKAIGADVRREIKRLGKESAQMEGDELSKLCESWAEKILPNIINHHRGKCGEDCGPWCEMQALKAAHPDWTRAQVNTEYLKGSRRFHSFVDISDESAVALMDFIRKRFNAKALASLRRMFTNNNCERFWTRLVKYLQGKRLNVTQTDLCLIFVSICVLENNEDLAWRQKLLDAFGLTTFEHQAAYRAKKIKYRKQTTKRKQSKKYIEQRRSRAQRIAERAGKDDGKGFKRKYSSNILHADNSLRKTTTKKKRKKNTKKKASAKKALMYNCDDVLKDLAVL